MKQVFLFLLAFSVCQISLGQAKGLELTHYLFPEFSKGTVLMKNGMKNMTSLNYNSLTEEMIFENNGVKLAFSQLEIIDTVFVNGLKFVVINNKFLEVVYQSKYTLFAENKCSIKDPGKPAGYGGTSQTSATSSYSSYFSGGQVYELKLPEGFQTKPYANYWLRRDGNLNKFISMRQLSKLFIDKADLFNSYVKNQKVKYENRPDLINLIKFLEAN